MYQLQTMRRWADASLFLLVAIVVTGATVRLTGSGLGCPDWPSCTSARPVPEVEYHALIEFFNRMVSLPTTIATIGAWWAARRLHPVRSDLRVGTTLVVAGVLVQIVLGGLTVRLELPPLIVAAHFLVSVFILAAATFVWRASRCAQPLRLRRPWTAAGATGALMLASLLGVIVAGVATTASGPHSGAEPGQIVERLGGGGLAVMLHARGAYAFAALLIVLIVWRVRSRAGARELVVVAALVAVQIALGEIQYRTGLPWQVVLAHVTTATLLWVTACSVATRALYRSGPDPDPAANAGRDESAENAHILGGMELGSDIAVR